MGSDLSLDQSCPLTNLLWESVMSLGLSRPARRSHFDCEPVSLLRCSHILVCGLVSLYVASMFCGLVLSVGKFCLWACVVCGLLVCGIALCVARIVCGPVLAMGLLSVADLPVVSSLCVVLVCGPLVCELLVGGSSKRVVNMYCLWVSLPCACGTLYSTLSVNQSIPWASLVFVPVSSVSLAYDYDVCGWVMSVVPSFLRIILPMCKNIAFGLLLAWWPPVFLWFSLIFVSILSLDQSCPMAVLVLPAGQPDCVWDSLSMGHSDGQSLQVLIRQCGSFS